MKFKISSLCAASALVAAMAIVGCSSNQSADNTEAGNQGEEVTEAVSSEEQAADVAAPGEAGFVETPIGEEVDVEPLHIAAVYFQPVDMEPVGKGLAKEDSDCHLEVDLSYLANDLGFEEGSWPAYCEVSYTILNSDGVTMNAQGAPEEGLDKTGTFMVMNADDGPHYGANIQLPDAGDYKLQVSIKSPAESDYLLHVDEETGVEGRFWTEPITAEFDWEGYSSQKDA